MKIVDFYFDFRSPYSYLARSQIEPLGVSVRYRPMDVLAVMKQVGNTPTTVLCASKGKYARVDLARWSKRYQVPIRPRSDMMTIDARRLLRVVLAAEDKGLAQQTVTAIFAAFWGTGAPLSTLDDLARVLDAAGLRASDLLDGVDDGARDVALTDASREAADRGVFGAPTFVADGEIFFGNDRLDFLVEHLEAA
jgi:2-hydroxychromene-2-carboxylate isomerase